jgi:hypothetical protein
VKKTFLLSALFFTTSVLAANQVHAQSSAELNLGVSPPLTHIIIQPGKSALTTIDIENQGTYDVDLTSKFVDFDSDNKSGVPVLSDSMSFPYITLLDDNLEMGDTFSLGRGEKKQLLFEVNLPESSIEKEYHFSLVLDITPQKNSLVDNSSAGVQGSIVTNFIVTVTRSEKDQGIIQLKSFESSLFLDSLSAVKAKVFVENSGKNTTVTLGQFRVLNAFGKVVYQNDILPQNILPGAVREILGSEKVVHDGQDFQIEKPFHYKPLFLLGPYKLVFTFHAPGQEEQTFEHTVFAFPVSFLIGIVLIYIIYLTNKRLFGGKKQKSTEF